MSLVMFDYDGVIADSYAQFIEDWVRVCKAHGVEFKSPGEAIDLFDGNVYESMRRLGVSDEAIDRILEEYRATAAFKEVKLFPEMPRALEEIAQLHRVVIITSNLSAVVREVLMRNGVRCVSEVIGAEEEKSKVKKIKAVISRYPGLTPYYVGDTKGDILEGRAAGAITVGVAWGWHPPERLAEGNPDYLVNTPEELVRLFRERLSSSF
ncbi:MAG: HAD family hydrolase [Desulfofundulus sp.]